MDFIMGAILGTIIGGLLLSTTKENDLYKSKNDLCKSCKHCILMRGYHRYGDNKCVYTDNYSEIRNRGDKVTICYGYEKREK